ncbi:NEL-type E3 ubiquitin ligase domain-containing protein [Pseudomonas putida]|uniref:NEL-type E3 ubiquitin ligase domain-containing protein n=1 Tax=Pseudomonas putida TaxID=303 RepID=UPI002AC6ABE4|nr:NEL-type E3 ubiquitin ligase domain-containing protein [Pseudomonas putida]MDZ5112099.1 NEL-type E3 ubiquitin ligase domain-containing protein [Pseudomonas putida]
MSQPAVHPKLLHPAEDFIAQGLPAWLKAAKPKQLAMLQLRFNAYLASQRQMAGFADRLQPLDRFAKQLLEPALRQDSQLKLQVDLDKLVWRETRARLDVRAGLIPDYQPYFVRMPALQKLLQNFKANESFFLGTALTLPQAHQAEQVVSEDFDRIVSLCREVDVGSAYQRHLAQVLTPDFEKALTTDRRLELAVAVEIAAIKQQLDPEDLLVLRIACKDEPAVIDGPVQLEIGALQVLGCRVDGAVAVELIEHSQSTFSFGVPGRLKRVILYTPDDQAQPLRAFTSWDEANRVLATAMGNQDYRQAFVRRIALGDRATCEQALATRLQDAQPDLEPRRVVEAGDGFASMAAWHMRRIKADARFLAVPTAQADDAASEQRLDELESAGLVLLNLAGLFVPVIGALLVADLARQLLTETFEGVRDWQLGHQHEALAHMLRVAFSVATTGAVVVGVHLARSAFVETLEPVITEDGRQRLWRNELAPYQETTPPVQLTELDNGLLAEGTRHWWRLDGALYRVRQTANGAWRLLHAEGDAAFGPVLERCSARGWRLAYERPLEWQGAALLLGRLWPTATAMDAVRMEQVLTVADVDEAYLRGLLVERRRMPVQLRDTLQRFAVDARAQAFFSRLEAGEANTDTELWQWCIERLQLQGETLEEQALSIGDAAIELREAMLEHFSRLYLADDPLLGLIQRDFPTLPDAYALDVLEQATEAMRLRMQAESRLPLALAEHARVALQLARLTRMREALYLQGSYRPEVVALAFALLRWHGPGAGDFNLILRRNPYAGAAMERLFAETDLEHAVVLVRRQGRFQLYNSRGLPDEREVAEPQGLFEVLAACLPVEYRVRQGWDGADAPARIRKQMQAWLPRDRQAVLRLLGWREARPMASPMQRLADGRLGYPLGGCQSCIGSPERVVRQRVRALYPGIGDVGVDRYIQTLLDMRGGLFENLLRVEQEYRRLDDSLLAWVAEGAGSASRARRRVADSLRRAWQMRSDRFVGAIGNDAMFSLSIVAVPVGGLPVLPVGTDFSHVSELTLSALGLDAIPSGFLACFPDLLCLDMSDNALRALPEGLERLTALRQLLMPRNRIRISAPQANVLTGLALLRSLDLSDNPLGNIRLQFDRLPSLRILRLNRVQMTALPSGLEWCGLLVFADLRNNQIAELPAALFQAPLQLRRAMHLEGNALAVQDLERLYGAERLLASPRPQRHASAREEWLQTLDPAVRQAQEGKWNALNAEPGSLVFFELLRQLTTTAEFSKASAELGFRVWAMLDAAHADTATRMALFDLAAEPTTCVDSVSTLFSRLEVRMHVEQATRGGDPISTRAARLQLAKRLFRVHWVEKIARREIDARYQDGRWSRGGHDEEEVEVNLAYLSGLAQRLDLLGQPRHMQFGRLANVSPLQLEEACKEVLQVEAGEQRIVFISERDFWLPVLRAEHPDDFEALETQFTVRLEALDEQREALTSDEYWNLSNALRDEREQALASLAQRLTREAIMAPKVQ